MKLTRKIVRIDEDKCDGCGLCVPSCAEGAIRVIDGKAKLISEVYCDGLGACLGECPRDAITIEEREAEAFDEEAVHEHLQSPAKPAPTVAPAPPAGGCPGMRALSLGAARKPAAESADTPPPGSVPSQLRQWPVQLHLVSPGAPYWQDADVLVCADCVPVAYGDFQAKLLKGKTVVIACPKLDDTGNYVAKLTALFANNSVRSVTVAHMEVPCCGGLVRMVETALGACGKSLPYTRVQIGISGDLQETVVR